VCTGERRSCDIITKTLRSAVCIYTHDPPRQMREAATSIIPKMVLKDLSVLALRFVFAFSFRKAASGTMEFLSDNLSTSRTSERTRLGRPCL
jgi:hypothetical protein